MFGYVQVRKPELKIKDYEIYRGFYCGLCAALKERYGFLGELTLTYDMTFLVILLSSVYDQTVQRKKSRCMMHPAKKHWMLSSESTEYAVHMNMILSYYHFLDDKEDEHSKKARVLCRLYQRSYKKAVRIYGKKAEQIKRSMKRLTALEKRGEKDIWKLADCFGRLMTVLFTWREDAFTDYFREFGYHLGCFIYIMDAYEDVGRDIEKGCFNPLKERYGTHGFDWQVEQMLFDEISAAAAAYRKLPCIAYQDILGNIIYAGVWNRFDRMKFGKKREGKGNERSV